jgi:hypothetical protein
MEHPFPFSLTILTIHSTIVFLVREEIEFRADGKIVVQENAHSDSTKVVHEIQETWHRKMHRVMDMQGDQMNTLDSLKESKNESELNQTEMASRDRINVHADKLVKGVFLMSVLPWHNPIYLDIRNSAFCILHLLFMQNLFCAS